MLKRNITYTDFNDEQVTEVFYFHVSNMELVELEASYDDGVKASIERLMESKDKNEILAIFKKLILSAYGVRSEDNKRFIKSQQLRDEFEQSAAFDQLVFELFTKPKAADEFITGALPKQLMEELGKQMPQDKPTGLPPVPRPPTK